VSKIAIVRPPGASGASIERDGFVVFRFDATVSEKHSRSATPTAHPVEDGADLTDHVRIEPRRLVLLGVATAVPFEEIERVPNRDRISFERLDDLLGAGRPISIVTTLRTYSNMVLSSVDVDRDARTGQAVFASLTFDEINVAQAREVSIPPELVASDVADGGSSEVDGGRQPTDPASETEADVASSWLIQSLGAFGG